MSLSIRTFLVFLVMGFGIGVLISCLSSRSREAQSQVPEQNVSPLADGKDTVQSRLDRRLDCSELVSTNLERYVSNLRGIKCPEDLVEAILRAEVEYSYLPRVLALNHPTKFIADPIPRMKVRSTEQAKLRTEIDEILYEKLRIDRPVTDSALFSAEEERQILYASTAFPNFPVDPTNPTSSALSQSNKLRRIDYLSQYLSPEG